MMVRPLFALAMGAATWICLSAASCTPTFQSPAASASPRVAPFEPPRPLKQVGYGRSAKFVRCAASKCPSRTPKTIATASTVIPAGTVQEQAAAPPQAIRPATLSQAAEQGKTGTVPTEPRPSSQAFPENDEGTSEPNSEATTEIDLATATRTVRVTFPFAGSKLTYAHRVLLEEALDAIPRALAVRIVGRTDSTGSVPGNDQLAAARAAAVRDFILEKRPDVASDIAVESKGSCCYVASNATPRGRAMNRRVEVVFSLRATRG